MKLAAVKRIVIFAIAAMTFASLLRAEAPKVEAIFAKDKDSKPATSFPADVSKIFAFFRSKGTHKGDKFRGVWIADDVGNVALANTKIDEATLDADDDNFYGAFSMTKPTSGWPVGKYHVDIYVNEQLATSPKFTITGAKSDKEKDENDAD